ncbi:MAG: hypothetical protein ABW128_00375 [Rhizorhabdus sp.]
MLVKKDNLMRFAALLMLSLLGLDAAEAAERLNFFRVRQGYATGTAKNGVARVHSQVDRGAPQGMAGPIALYQVARLAQAAGELQFVVVKNSCGTLVISGVRASNMCDVKARFGAATLPEDVTVPVMVADTIAAFEGNAAYYRPY